MTEDLDYLPKPASNWRGLGDMLRTLERRTGDRIPSGDVALANRDMRKIGCRTRYRPDLSAKAREHYVAALRAAFG